VPRVNRNIANAPAKGMKMVMVRSGKSVIVFAQPAVRVKKYQVINTTTPISMAKA